jgi:hypothetical protein
MKFFAFMIVTTIGLFSPFAYCAEVAPAPPAAQDGAGAKNQGSKESSFFDNFGVGLAVVAKMGRERSIQEAQLVNGIVRVTSERQVMPMVVLERHWYFNPDRNSGWGTFLGVNLATQSNIIDGIGLGLIYGFKPSSKSNTTTSNNLGFGFAVQPFSRVLGDGIAKDQALPAGETAIRYKETNRTGFMLFYTYTM